MLTEPDFFSLLVMTISALLMSRPRSRRWTLTLEALAPEIASIGGFRQLPCKTATTGWVAASTLLSRSARVPGTTNSDSRRDITLKNHFCWAAASIISRSLSHMCPSASGQKTAATLRWSCHIIPMHFCLNTGRSPNPYFCVTDGTSEYSAIEALFIELEI